MAAISEEHYLDKYGNPESEYSMEDYGDVYDKSNPYTRDYNKMMGCPLDED